MRFSNERSEGKGKEKGKLEVKLWQKPSSSFPSPSDLLFALINELCGKICASTVNGSFAHQLDSDCRRILKTSHMVPSNSHIVSIYEIRLVTYSVASRSYE